MKLTKFVGKLDLEQRKQFCELAGTKHTHLWQLLGGHRAASLRMLCALVRASKVMFPDDRCVRARDRRWLTLDELHTELEEIQLRRAQIREESAS